MIEEIVEQKKVVMAPDFFKTFILNHFEIRDIVPSKIDEYFESLFEMYADLGHCPIGHYSKKSYEEQEEEDSDEFAAQRSNWMLGIFARVYDYDMSTYIHESLFRRLAMSILRANPDLIDYPISGDDAFAMTEDDFGRFFIERPAESIEKMDLNSIVMFEGLV